MFRREKIFENFVIVTIIAINNYAIKPCKRVPDLTDNEILSTSCPLIFFWNVCV